MKLFRILPLVILLAACQPKEPVLPVADQIFTDGIHPVSYQINFFDLAPDGTVYGGAGTGLFRIIENGDGIEEIFRFDDQVRAVHFRRDGLLLVATDNDHWDPLQASRLYRSRDMGKTFALVKTTTGGSFLWWSLDSAADGTIYAGEYGPDTRGLSKTVWQSSDDGETWISVFQAPDRDKVHVHRVAVDPFSGNLWVTIGDGDNRATYLSEDAGANWTPQRGSQATAVAFTKDAIYWGEDRKKNSGVVRVDRKSGKSVLALDAAKGGNYGGSVYDMVAGSSGTVYVPFMKYPQQEHVASLWAGQGEHWIRLMHLASRPGSGSGRETIAGPDRNGWIYISGYKIRDRAPEEFANRPAMKDNAG